MTLKAIISVKYSSGHDIGEGWVEEELRITPLHTDPVQEGACFTECNEFWGDMLDQWYEDKVPESDTLFSTILEVSIMYSEDYWGDTDVEYDCKLISHNKIAVENEDGDWEYVTSKPDTLAVTLKDFGII